MFSDPFHGIMKMIFHCFGLDEKDSGYFFMGQPFFAAELKNLFLSGG